MKEYGFKQAMEDHTLALILPSLLYVGDMIVTCSNLPEIEELQDYSAM